LHSLEVDLENILLDLGWNVYVDAVCGSVHIDMSGTNSEHINNAYNHLNGNCLEIPKFPSFCGTNLQTSTPALYPTMPNPTQCTCCGICPNLIPIPVTSYPSPAPVTSIPSTSPTKREPEEEGPSGSMVFGAGTTVDRFVEGLLIGFIATAIIGCCAFACFYMNYFGERGGEEKWMEVDFDKLNALKAADASSEEPKSPSFILAPMNPFNDDEHYEQFGELDDFL